MPQYYSRIICICLLLAGLFNHPIYCQPSATYEQQLKEWNKSRVDYLKSENGWLNLAGLYWLQQGENKMGTDEAYPIIFPAEKAPAYAGYLLLEQDKVTLHAAPDISFTIGSKQVNQALIFHPDSANQPLVALGSLRFQIIRRGDKIGVRLRDLQHPAISAFKGIECFKPDTSFRVMARLQQTKGATIAIRNVLGQTIQQASPGKLVFTLHGQTYSLDALTEGDELFILFGDKTNGIETYGAGRFLYAAMPGEDGRVWLDFNKAINPPCAFTNYATCPLPPRQNQLPMRIEAGEKFEGHH